MGVVGLKIDGLLELQREGAEDELQPATATTAIAAAPAMSTDDSERMAISKKDGHRWLTCSFYSPKWPVRPGTNLQSRGAAADGADGRRPPRVDPAQRFEPTFHLGRADPALEPLRSAW